MNNNNRLSDLVKEVEFAIADQRDFRARGTHLIIRHLYHLPGTSCAPGEMVGDVALGGTPNPLWLAMSPRALLIIDCLHRHRVGLTAQRLEYILNSDPFYTGQGTNGNHGIALALQFDQRSIRAYVARIQEQFTIALHRIGVSDDGRQVLKCSPTEANLIAYSLNATVECVHVDVENSHSYPIALRTD